MSSSISHQPAQPPAAPKHRFWRQGTGRSLKREIIFALLIKLALLMLLKHLFFSHPLSKEERAARLEAMITSDTGTMAPAKQNTQSQQ